KADAVLVKIPWRRRDHNPERKQIIVMDATSGQRITNIARLHLDRFEGVLAFQPQTAPGDCFVYYLPFAPQPGWGSYDRDYLAPQETAAPEWKSRLPQNTDALPRATVLRLEARTEFDSFYPMEVVATEEETRALLDRTASMPGIGPVENTYLLFLEDRRFPIRMTDDLPLRWVKGSPSREFRGDARLNEFYVFQIGVWAGRTNLAGLQVEFKGGIASWLNCFNTGGTNWDGKPFRKPINVPQGNVQALWIGVDVPRNAEPGEHRARVTIRSTNAPPANIDLVLTVLASEVADRGDSEPWRLSRLRWLNSRMGLDSSPTRPYSPLTADAHSVSGSGFRVTFGSSQVCDMPSALSCSGNELLSGQIGLFIEGDDEFRKGPQRVYVGPTPASGTGRTKLISGHAYRNVRVTSVATTEFDGTISFTTQLHGEGDFKTDNLRLEIPLRPEIATYFMGIGLPGCHTPTNYTWRWTGPYNSFWIGGAHAGLHLKLLGSAYEGPMQNLYHPKPPPGWFNGGKGGVTITNGPKGEVLVQVFTGPFEMKAGEQRAFDFSLLLTPVKLLDPATHFNERYWHSTHDIPDGVNIINVHHATTPNPFINYPFLAIDTLRAFCRTNQAAGRKVKVYYTVRELTTRLPELWALRSLGDEVLAGGS
ncbi:MAG: DUF6067 family protein, partial [Verrucomicrobia bacterium]|nr:DUF6067 family protein [Verrucomicrobiota bacterium]